jgi:tRNA modification GTPase
VQNPAPSPDTIYALASGLGKAAIAVLRLSGPGCDAAVLALTGKSNLPDRQAVFTALKNPVTGEILDRALVLRFRAPRSYTGEDMLELQVTGGRAVAHDVLAALATLKGFRPAEPGEFALRAFENGKVDLTEVEGLADLVDAETSAQRRQAVRIAGGALRREADEIRASVVKAMAAIDALLDFSDIEDAEDFADQEFRQHVLRARARIKAALDGSLQIRKLREGFTVVLAGPPNAGKSTLMNALSKQEASIVSATPGTTRDVIEVALDLGGYPVVLVDTAGIRESDDAIEAEGVRRALKRVENADLVLWLSETDGFATPPEVAAPATLRVRTKVDASPVSEADTASEPSLWPKRLRGAPFSPCGRRVGDEAPTPHPAFGGLLPQGEKETIGEGGSILAVSALTGAGVPELLAVLQRHAETALAPASHSLITRERHKLAFREADASLESALEIGLSVPELAGEELRRAARRLERVAGRVGVEDVLDEIFSSLCVGK